jgi:hypothetical protein
MRASTPILEFGSRSTPDSAIGRRRPSAIFPRVDERARALGRLYDEVTAEVKALVDRADPEGLLGMGAPADEYDDAVAELTRRVLKDEPLDSASIERWFSSVYGAAPAGAGALAQELAKLRQRAQNDGP